MSDEGKRWEYPTMELRWVMRPVVTESGILGCETEWMENFLQQRWRVEMETTAGTLKEFYVWRDVPVTTEGE